MTTKENIKAILACNFSGFKDEYIETATDRIMETVKTTCANTEARTMNNDLISREDLKKAINEKKYPRVCEDYIHGYNDGLNEIIDLIDNAPTITFDKVHSYDVGYSEGIKECDRLKAENNRLTAELERVYELYNGLIASKQEQPRKGCPFGDQRETCAEFSANGCDLCKFATS